jgi:hypothetical protein
MGQRFRTLTSRRASSALSVCAVLICAVPVRAQQPMPDTPAKPAFMSRFDFRMWAAALAKDDPRFKWDTHWAGDFDLVDYVAGRATFVADYQALLGNEFRPFDPYQSNYLLEAAGSVRLRKVEVFAVLSHVSRHLGDRAKRVAVAENSLGPRVLKRLTSGATTVDLRGDWRKVIERAYDDYSWIGSAEVTVRHPVTVHASLYGSASGETYLIEKAVSTRDRQDGGRFEAGVRVRGSAAAMDFFGGIQRMVDADPLDRLPQSWVFAGFRLVGK